MNFNGMTDLTTVNEVIKELESLRGAEVKVFGQPTILNSEVDNLTIDTVSVLERLKDFEVDYADVEPYVDFSDVDRADNSYNWCAPLNHHVDFTIYKSELDFIIVSMAVQLYGDVRGNYTDVMLFKFDNDYEFYEVLTEANKHGYIEVDGKDYYYDVDILSDVIDIYNEYGEYICSSCPWDNEELINDIKEVLAK